MKLNCGGADFVEFQQQQEKG